MKKTVSVILAVIIAFVVFSTSAFAVETKGAGNSLYNFFDKVDYTVKCTDTKAKLTFSKYGDYVIYGNINIPFNLSVAETNKAYTFTNLYPSTSYTYKIFDRSGRSEKYLFDVKFTTNFNAPDIETEYSQKSINLWWRSYDNLTYEVYKSHFGDKYQKIATLKGKGYYSDKEIESGYTYSYYVVVSDGNAKKTSQTVSKKAAIIMDLPDISGTCKTYAYYTAVTATESPQYKLLHSPECHTDYDTGIRMIGKYYCIALGSYYGTKIGTKYHITLSSGNDFYAILCDQKADRHTNSTHQYAVNNNDIIEFYVEGGYIPRGVNGDYGSLPQFSGSVVSIEKLQ